MSEAIDIAVVGATGAVGEAMMEILEQREFPVESYTLWRLSVPRVKRCDLEVSQLPFLILPSLISQKPQLRCFRPEGVSPRNMRPALRLRVAW